VIWWWLGNAVFVLAVIPVVTLLLHRLLAPVLEIQAYVEDVAEHGSLALQALDCVDALAQTQTLVADVGAGVQRYGAALDELL
jgi:hypothetical protein